MRLGKLGVQVKGLFAVKESLFVLALLDVGHGPVGEHTLVLVQVDCGCVELNCLVDITSFEGSVTLVLLSLSTLSRRTLFFLF